MEHLKKMSGYKGEYETCLKCEKEFWSKDGGNMCDICWQDFLEYVKNSYRERK